MTSTVRLPLPAAATTVAPARLVAAAAACVTTGFLAVFLAGAGRITAGIVLDALANVLAIALVAVPVALLCRRVPWRAWTRWWFVPLHALAAVAFAQCWWVVLAWVLAAAAALRGMGFTPVWLEGPARHWQLLTAGFVYTAIAAACYAVQAARDWREATALRHEAELAALRAQLDPHLLFNTLHSLLELVRSGDARADDAIDRFARLARYASGGRGAAGDLVPLAEEWRLVEDYLALEALRLGARLSWTLALDPAVATLALPALTLQPLVENAIVHGIAPRAGAGRVAVRAAREGDAFVLVVEDDGLGAAAGVHEGAPGSGRGLALVRRRLELHAGDALAFAAGPRADGTGWRVTVRLPLEPARVPFMAAPVAAPRARA